MNINIVHNKKHDDENSLKSATIWQNQDTLPSPCKQGAHKIFSPTTSVHSVPTRNQWIPASESPTKSSVTSLHCCASSSACVATIVNDNHKEEKKTSDAMW